MASVGQELLDVPLPDMVTKLALGIAEAQRPAGLSADVFWLPAGVRGAAQRTRILDRRA